MVTWRRAQTVLLSAQGVPVAKIAEVSFTSDNRVRDVIHSFNADGFDARLDGTGHAGHKERGSVIRRCIIWRQPPCRRPSPTRDHRQDKRCLPRHWVG